MPFYSYPDRYFPTFAGYIEGRSGLQCLFPLMHGSLWHLQYAHTHARTISVALCVMAVFCMFSFSSQSMVQDCPPLLDLQMQPHQGRVSAFLEQCRGDSMSYKLPVPVKEKVGNVSARAALCAADTNPPTTHLSICIWTCPCPCLLRRYNRLRRRTRCQVVAGCVGMYPGNRMCSSGHPLG